MRAISLCALTAAAVVAAGCGGTSAPKSLPGTQAAALPPAPHLDPYKAAVRYAQCYRARGIPHPYPDANGDFHLTPAQERKMRAVATPKQLEAADAACFHFLEGTVSTQPLSAGAKRAALVPLRDLKRCLHGYGYEMGNPMVRNLSRGRAMFGFESGPGRPADAGARKKLEAAQHTCERKVKLAARIDAIVKADRGEDR